MDISLHNHTGRHRSWIMSWNLHTTLASIDSGLCQEIFITTAGGVDSGLSHGIVTVILGGVETSVSSFYTEIESQGGPGSCPRALA